METAYTETGLTVAKVRKGYIVPAIVEAIRLAREKWPKHEFTVAANESAATVDVRVVLPNAWVWG